MAPALLLADHQRLVERFRPEAEADVVRRIEERLGAEAAPVVDVYHHYRARLQVYLRRLSRYRAGRTWLNDPALYAWVRALHQGGRVIPRTCDVTGPPTLIEIGEATRRLRIPVRTVYLSNLEMFVANRPPLVALLDGTPVLDVKPYVAAVDAFPGARAGWVDEME